MLHQYDRWEFLDKLLHEAAYDVVMVEYVIPKILLRLRTNTYTK